VSADNKVIARKWFEEVWNKGRAAAIDEMCTASVAVHGLGPDMQGTGAFKQFHTAYRDAFPDVAIHIDGLIAEGDMVAVRWSGTGTHRGGGLGFPPTGRAIRFTGMAFLRIENGKLVEGWNNFDQLGMFQQLGVVNL
jgi:steroid delta-isomerase-like uncharacterized protein